MSQGVTLLEVGMSKRRHDRDYLLCDSVHSLGPVTHSVVENRLKRVFARAVRRYKALLSLPWAIPQRILRRGA